MIKSGELHFSVDCRLLFELGEQLVARKSVALAELVKNAYDADATKVIIKLERVTHPAGSIVVKDNGLGMTLAAAQEAWMRIATIDKYDQPISLKYKRLRVGAKGIGRFASRRLARELIVKSVSSTKDGNKEELTVIFDWDRFKPGEDIQQISNEYHVRTVPKTEPSGVTLVLNDLRDIWIKEDVAELERDLLGLVSPFPFPRELTAGSSHAADPGFSIDLQAPEFQEFEGKLSQKFLTGAWGVLSGHVDKEGKAQFRLKIRGRETVRYRSEKVFENLGAAYLRMYFFIYRNQFFKALPFSVGQARQFAKNQSGVRIYIDKFRVFPYGDPGDDWLDLDADRGRRLTALAPELTDIAEELERPMLLLPGNNQLFGAVFISRSHNPGIALNISRERLLENVAFNELKSFARLGINWMTVHYARYLARQQKKEPDDDQGDPLAHLKKAREQIEATEELDRETRVRILQALDLARTDYERQQKEQISEISMIRVLASAGTMVVIFDHELRAVVDSLKGLHTDLKKYASKLVGSARKEYSNLLSQLKKWVDSVEQQGAQLGLLLSRDARQRRRKFALRQVVDEMVSPFSRYMDDLGVKFSNNVPADLRSPPMFECELQSILINLHTNALKAVKGKSVRKIAVFGKQRDGRLVISFRDTGVGIDPGMREEAFNPFVTTTEPDPVLGAGTGLGLKIVRDLLEIYGGSARFVNCTSPWKTCIEIEIPYI